MPSPASVMETKKWPDWDRICNASDTDLEDHAWYRLRLQPRDEPAPSVDKGKSRASDGSGDTNAIEEPRGRIQTRPVQQEKRHSLQRTKRIKLEVPEPVVDNDNNETFTATAATPAASASTRNCGRTRTRPAQQDKHSHSHSHQRTKLVKSEPTVDTDSDEKLTPAASASVENYGRSMAHIHTAAEGFEVAKEGEKCIMCRKKNLPCAVKPGRACWQCYCSRSGCSTFAATGRRVASRAPTPWQSCKQRASTGTTPGLTSRSPSAKPAVSRRQSKSFVLCILIC